MNGLYFKMKKMNASLTRFRRKKIGTAQRVRLQKNYDSCLVNKNYDAALRILTSRAYKHRNDFVYWETLGLLAMFSNGYFNRSKGFLCRAAAINPNSEIVRQALSDIHSLELNLWPPYK
jgi:hypothetical protein